VTFANGRWQGSHPIDAGDSKRALDSCPAMWDYLAQAGRDGWELVAVVSEPVNQETSATRMFLKRELS
jgi:hypothetical protein